MQILIAQTNLQLFRQLHDLGWPLEDIRRIQADYEFIAPVFAGWLRGCGKPILCHLVGTASVLAAEGLPLPVVRLGMVHAIYQYGKLNLRQQKIAAARRAEVRQFAGEDLEADIFRYRQIEFKHDDVQRFLASSETLTLRDRRVLTTYLANEVDDHLDLAIHVTDKPRKLQEDWLPACIELAQALDLPGLAERLRQTIASDRDGTWMNELNLGRPGTFDAVPRPAPAKPGKRRLLGRLLGRRT